MSHRRSYQPWNDAERASLRQAYKDRQLTMPDIEAMLGRSRWSIYMEASRLGITRPKRPSAKRPVAAAYDWHAHAAELRRRGIGEATVRAMLATMAPPP